MVVYTVLFTSSFLQKLSLSRVFTGLLRLFHKFPANSLLFCEICDFWAEFDDSTGRRKKFPANFPVILANRVFLHFFGRPALPLAALLHHRPPATFTER